MIETKAFQDDMQSSCSICLSDFKEDEDVKMLPCRHCFHQTCLEQWFHHSTNCAFCRFDVTYYVLGKLV